ncbi:STAS domain-containing protein [Rapidithrix thailandica]|uniref:Anti-sigma factor antagonist n=1 Tax=Rapidithrix thailandica TaxID=413964 RepID=A0AAW9S3J9_9BACT
MEVKTFDENGYHIIAVYGDVDASSSLQLDNVLQEAVDNQKQKILVDCTHLEYISSPGIGVFTSRLEDCEKGLIRIALYGMNENTLKVFKILGLDQLELMPIVDTKEEAKSRINDLQEDR